MFQFRTIADTLRPGRRGATTLPRHIRGGTTDSGISESPSLTAGSYLPMDRLRFGNQSILPDVNDMFPLGKATQPC